MEKVIIGNAELYHGDCLEILPTLPKVDAVITDPPYGINFGNAGGFCTASGWKHDRGCAEWDKARPSKEAIDSLLSAGEAVIIWGGNYFTDCLPPSMQWLIWDKVQRGFSLADAEMAWSNRNKATRVFSYARGNESGFAPKGSDGYQNSHPTQKPMALMRWCIQQAGEPKVVLDPYMGSGSTGVAAMQMGIKFTGIEIDQKYFDIACKRIEAAQQQLQLFGA